MPCISVDIIQQAWVEEYARSAQQLDSPILRWTWLVLLHDEKYRGLWPCT